MSYVLTLNGAEIARSRGWTPRLFGELTGTSFPAQIPDGWVWGQDGWTLAWEVDPPAPPPEPQYKTQFTSLEYLDRFTEAEQITVVTVTQSNAQVKLWYDKMLAASYVDIADPRVSAGLDALIAAGLLAPARKAEILAPEPV